MLIDMKVWLNHFEYHARRRVMLPEGKPYALSCAERRRIAKSIAIFQLGEDSEGQTLLKAARDYEDAHDAAPVARIIELLVKEEQQHAALIGAFMDQHGIARRQNHWTEWAFRKIRRLAGLELYISVFITAELIGKVYYRALECATESRQLQVLCRSMVADELAHVGFEADLLRTMRARRPQFTRSLISPTHRFFLAGVAFAVWVTHQRVLRHAGYRTRTFMRACNAQYSFYLGSCLPADRASRA